MAGGDTEEDRQYEPTPRKLDEARKKGDVARSADLNVAATYAGFLVCLATAGLWSVSALGTGLMAFLDRPEEVGRVLAGRDSALPGGRPILAISTAAAPSFLVPAVAAMASIAAQRALVLAPEKIVPKLSRISPVENAKNKFGRSGLFEFLKSATKLMVFSVALGMYLATRAPQIIGSAFLPPAGVVRLIGSLCLEFLFIICCISATIAAVDFLWQIAEHRRRNRMSHKELTDEARMTEGDPHMKGARRQRAYDIAMNKMLAEVPGAEVVIVNPTHFAVALAWNRLPDAAPVLVAKGTDHVAARIRESAAIAGVPIRRDPVTARAIYAHIDIGQEIRPEDYRAVAAAIRFAEQMRRKRRWTTTSG